MARKTAKSGDAPLSSPAAEPRSLLWLQGLVCGGLVTLATPTALLLGVLFGPALLATMLDRQFGRPIARCIALGSLSAVVAPIRTLWSAGQTMDAALVLASDAETIGWAWGAAAAGWLMVELTPIGVRAVLETISLSRTIALVQTRGRLETEWGLPPGEGPEGK